LKQAESKNKILQEEKNSMIMDEKDIMVSDYVTNTQSDIIIHSKTQTDVQENQSNKRASKKSITNLTPKLYRRIKLTPEKDRFHWANRLLNEVL